jgi:hypothetical protein
MKAPSIIILSNKSNTFGLQQDVNNLLEVLGGEHCDPLEYPKPADIIIHLEVPAYVWMPYAKKNILVVNPEWFQFHAWNSYLSKFDQIITKDEVATRVFDASKTRVIPWATRFRGRLEAPKEEFVWLIGGSKNKRAYVERLLAAWRSEYPRLTIYSMKSLGLEAGPNVSFQVGDLEPKRRLRVLQAYKGHICCSKAEGFGYTAGEAEAVGAFVILNQLPCYVQDYTEQPGVAFLPSKLVSWFDESSSADIQPALDDAIQRFRTEPWNSLDRIARAEERWNRFAKAWKELVGGGAHGSAGGLEILPPVLPAHECPPISIITPVYNRRKFFDLAYHSILVSDYPKDRIEWIIVDDSDDPMDQPVNRIMEVMKAGQVKIEYLPLKKRTPVGQKRNIGIEKATAEIVLMMDDDDHYPETSFRRRVAWLTKHPWKPKIVSATTIACYDLNRGISAVNTPPLDIPLGQRVSEATLTFYKSAWLERKFTNEVQVGEGEEFVHGREEQVLEIPPQQIIVAFSHGKNVSSRRVPSDADVKPGCFWGFPKEFLEFIHGLV